MMFISSISCRNRCVGKRATSQHPLFTGQTFSPSWQSLQKCLGVELVRGMVFLLLSLIIGITSQFYLLLMGWGNVAPSCETATQFYFNNFSLNCNLSIKEAAGSSSGVLTINLLLWSRLNLLFDLPFTSMCWVNAVLSVLFNVGRH